MQTLIFNTLERNSFHFYRARYEQVVSTLLYSGGIACLRHIVRLAAPFVLLPLISGCQSEDTDQLKSEIESLKQEISQLSESVGKIESEVKDMKEMAFKPPQKRATDTA